MKIIAGMLQGETGTVEVLGFNPMTQRVPLMRELGVLFGNRTELWWDHPISVSFDWKKVVWGIPDDTYRRNLEQATDLLDLKPLVKTFARELSLGQRMRADLAMLLLHNPRVIILDEPTLGLDVLAKRNIIDYLKRLNRENGVTVLITSHDMDDLEAMAERIIMIAGGEIAFDGSFDQMRGLTTLRRRIKITTESKQAPILLLATHLSSQDSIHEFEYDSSIVTMPKLLAELAELPGIRDMETGKIPIEDVVSELYTKWR